MMVEPAPVVLAALHWLPRSEIPPRELHPRGDELSAVLQGLAEERHDGSLVIRGGNRELVLLMLDGLLIAASLRTAASVDLYYGAAAVRRFLEQQGAEDAIAAEITRLPRPVVECLVATLDPRPTTLPLDHPERLRATLREAASRGHHGLVDLVAGDQWGRALFHRGRLLGAYHHERPTVAPSLAALGQLASAGYGHLVLRGVPAGPLPRLHWPPSAAAPAWAVPPVPATAGTATDRRAATREPQTTRPVPTAAPDAARDEKIETQLLWLLSHVDRDRDRATRHKEPRAQDLQVLAVFANALRSITGQVTVGAARAPSTLLELCDTLRAEHPAITDLPLRDGELDGPGLARQFRALPAEENTRTWFHGGAGRAILAIVRHTTTHLLQEIGESTTRERCQSAVATWLDSVEAALPASGPTRTR